MAPIAVKHRWSTPPVDPWAAREALTGTEGTYVPVNGVTAGLITAESALTLNSSATLSTDDASYTSVVFSGQDLQVATDTGGLRFRNCLFEAGTGTPAGNRAGITALNSGIEDLVFEDCLFRIATPHHLRDAFRGYKSTLRRCVFQFGVDGLGLFPSGSGVRLDSKVLGCIVEELAWWTASTTGVVHPSDTTTHNDCIEWQGGAGLEVRGNVLKAYYSRTVGHYPSGNVQPIPDRGSGTEANGRYNIGDLCGLMIARATSRDQCTELANDRNWYYGGNMAVNAQNPNSGSANTGAHTNNRFSRDQGGQSSGGNTTWTLNLLASQQSAGATATGNVYDDDSAAVQVRWN